MSCQLTYMSQRILCILCKTCSRYYWLTFKGTRVACTDMNANVFVATNCMSRSLLMLTPEPFEYEQLSYNCHVPRPRSAQIFTNS